MEKCVKFTLYFLFNDAIFLVYNGLCCVIYTHSKYCFVCVAIHAEDFLQINPKRWQQSIPNILRKWNIFVFKNVRFWNKTLN